MTMAKAILEATQDQRSSIPAPGSAIIGYELMSTPKDIRDIEVEDMLCDHLNRIFAEFDKRGPVTKVRIKQSRINTTAPYSPFGVTVTKVTAELCTQEA
jgi:hypothetical protein